MQPEIMLFMFFMVLVTIKAAIMSFQFWNEEVTSYEPEEYNDWLDSQEEMEVDENA